MGLLRRRRLPSSARPSLARNERIVAWAPTAHRRTDAVVVTTLGVWLPGRDRLGWDQVHKASWSGSRLTVVPSTLVEDRAGYRVLADDVPVAVELADPDTVPAEIRSRVTRSVAHTSHHPVPGGGVRVVGRRVPGADGLRWDVRYDDGTDPVDPDVVSATDELVTAASTS